ncbi:porin [Aliikangiella sp. IMCC44653]
MKILRKSIIFCILCVPLALQAAEINFSGFATLAGGKLSEEIEFRGYDDEIGFASNSLLALQASADLGDGWGVTTQLISRGSENWEVDSEWAYLSYDASDNWRLLFGRQRLPLYIYSDFLDVSYAYHWISPPEGVYSLPFDVIDGIGSIYSNSFGGFDSSLHLTYGRTEGNIEALDADTVFKNAVSVAWTLNRDWFTLRLGYAQTDLSILSEDLSNLAQAWRDTGPLVGQDFSTIGDNIESIDDKGTFAGVGIIIDYNDFLFVTEFTDVDPGNNLLQKQESFYVSFGKRWGDALLHVTYGEDLDVVEDVLGAAASIPPLAGLVAATNGVAVGLEEDSKFYTVGLRWELSDSVAMKIDYTDYDDLNPVNNTTSIFQVALTTVF